MLTKEVHTLRGDVHVCNGQLFHRNPSRAAARRRLDGLRTLFAPQRPARFSRRNDYRRHASVTKVTLPSHILMPTMAAAESAIVSWARELVEHSGEVLEVSLQLAEDAHT
ncbi:hypothetical protein [Caballeronia sp. CLC5]|uniref:hypothetical protein n=1 Tax=Caballeronia sp. CLC5 TaxID=2906764 RepID=UPI001F45A144|nr:hypothetical protein [Caballeronia sp. CLC5]MCE4574361.1 hypothetical protein [Caballeronia sp. CLC5]